MTRGRKALARSSGATQFTLYDSSMISGVIAWEQVVRWPRQVDRCKRIRW